MPRLNVTGGRSRFPFLPISLSQRELYALDGLAALLGCLATAFVLRSAGHPHRLVAVSLTLISSAPILLRRRWPIPVLAVVTAGIAGLVILGQLPFTLTAMLGLAGYMVAALATRRSSVVALMGAEAVSAVAIALARLSGSRSLEAYVIESILSLVAAWLVGDTVKARRIYLAGLADQAQQQRITDAERGRQGIREERIRIARELHDVVAHSLAVITVQAGVARRLMSKQPGRAGTALMSIEGIGRTAQNELRVVLGLLRDGDTEPADLTPAPGLADLKELVVKVRDAGTPVELRISGREGQLSAALQLTVYRIIQEAPHQCGETCVGSACHGGRRHLCQ